MTDLYETYKLMKKSPLGEIADHLGFLCMAWSWLELEINAALLIILQPAEETTTAAVIYNMDFRDKLKAILAAGFTKKPSDEWFAELKTLIDEVDNDLRNERNRMVHDSWHWGGDDIFRVTTHAKVAHEQAKKLSIYFGEGKTMKPSDIFVLIVRVFAAGGHIDDLMARYRAAHSKPSPDRDA